jgi:hypothetical protein
MIDIINCLVLLFGVQTVALDFGVAAFGTGRRIAARYDFISSTPPSPAAARLTLTAVDSAHFDDLRRLRASQSSSHRNMSVPDPKKRADSYLQQHSLHAVIQGCIAQLLYHKPTDPRAFLVQQLELLKVSRQPSLLNRRDLSAMFCMFDITGRGYVTAEQADNALGTILGAEPADAAAQGSGADVVGQLAKQREMDPHQFVEYMAERLRLGKED